MTRYAVEEYVRWEDIDGAGIINYQAYLRLFALAEVEMFRACGLSHKVLTLEFGLWLPRVRVECDFFHPVRLDDLLLVESFLGRLGRTSLQLNFEVHRKGEPRPLIATGKYVLVAVRQQDFAKVPIPEELRRRIAPYVVPSAG